MRYDRMYLFVNYGIVGGDGAYLVPDYSSDSDWFLDEKKCEEEGLCLNTAKMHQINFDNLEVERGDVLFVTGEEDCKGNKTTIRVANLRNKTEGFVRGFYGSDESRLNLVNSIAKCFKDVGEVTVKNYLIYNDREVEEYVASMEELLRILRRY